MKMDIPFNSGKDKFGSQEVTMPTRKPAALAVSAEYEAVPPNAKPLGNTSWVTWPITR
jgi:hypothetical protein